MTLPESVQKWTKALRSGEYKQGHARLATIDDNNDVKYCCLGVACEVYMKEFPGKLDKKASQYTLIYQHRYSGTLPPLVQEWLGFKNPTGAYKKKEDDHCFTLIQYNDAEEYTFNQIADVIEQDYKYMKEVESNDIT